MLFLATDLKLLYDGEDYYISQAYFVLKRYYENFGKFIICSRISRTKEIPNDFNKCTEMFEDVITYNGFATLTKKSFKQRVSNVISSVELVVGRMPSFTGNFANKIAKKLKKPFYSEVMGDAWDMYFHHSLKGKIIAPYMYFETKKVLKNSNYALYVTSKYLQEKYPCKNQTVGVSNVKISKVEDKVLKERLDRIQNLNLNQITLTTTAAIDVWYKGQQFVIQALPILNKLGINVKYRLIGGGDNTRLLNLAKKLGVESQVEFVGRKPLNEVFPLLVDTDIYIQPSLQEGLPRSVIEAMSRACPALGARTAGIPELINKKCVFKRKSPKAIAKAVFNVLDKETLSALAIENFNEAQNYTEAVLNAKRNAYYDKVKKEVM